MSGPVVPLFLSAWVAKDLKSSPCYRRPPAQRHRPQPRLSPPGGRAFHPAHDAGTPSHRIVVVWWRATIVILVLLGGQTGLPTALPLLDLLLLLAAALLRVRLLLGGVLGTPGVAFQERKA